MLVDLEAKNGTRSRKWITTLITHSMIHFCYLGQSPKDSIILQTMPPARTKCSNTGAHGGHLRLTHHEKGILNSRQKFRIYRYIFFLSNIQAKDFLTSDPLGCPGLLGIFFFLSRKITSDGISHLCYYGWYLRAVSAAAHCPRARQGRSVLEPCLSRGLGREERRRQG